jgi:hypothetical protein
MGKGIVWDPVLRNLEEREILKTVGRGDTETRGKPVRRAEGVKFRSKKSKSSSQKDKHSGQGKKPLDAETRSKIPPRLCVLNNFP